MVVMTLQILPLDLALPWPSVSKALPFGCSAVTTSGTFCPGAMPGFFGRLTSIEVTGVLVKSTRRPSFTLMALHPHSARAKRCTRKICVTNSSLHGWDLGYTGRVPAAIVSLSIPSAWKYIVELFFESRESARRPDLPRRRPFTSGRRRPDPKWPHGESGAQVVRAGGGTEGIWVGLRSVHLCRACCNGSVWETPALL